MFLGYIDPGTGFTVVSLGGGAVALLLGFLGMFSLFFKRIFRFFNRHKKITTIILLLSIMLGLIAGIFMVEKKAKFDKKVIILGFDGLSPEIIEPMIEKGELPNFSRLKEQGSYRRLATTNPSQSPVAWVGFATGKNPGKTGIYDFIVRDPDTYGLRLSLSNIEKGKPKQVVKSKSFWDYTSEKRVPTTIITCPVTFPPAKVYGQMLSGMGVPDILGTEGTFTFYTSEYIDKEKDIGGKVFQIRKSDLMLIDLIGPKVAVAKGPAENKKVPVKVSLEKDSSSITIEYQNNRFQLKKGQWSDWEEVTFSLGLFKNAKGILKFYLVELEPDFKLYVSPINFSPKKPFFQISYPKSYSRELAENIGYYYTQGMPMDTWSVNEKRMTEKPFLEQVNEVLREKKAMLDFELGRFKKGVLFCYFESPDIIQHMFWRYIDPKHPLYEEDVPLPHKEIIYQWYKNMDKILGDTMKILDKEDVLIVLSDHGFDTFRRAAHLNTWLRRNGYLKLKDPDLEKSGELLEDIDWLNTKAYAIGFGAIYINQAGREKYGIVKPGQEAEILKKEISKKLKAWFDEKYNKPVVNDVYSRQDIFWGKYADETPDLYVGFNIGYRASWQTALGSAPKELLEDNLKKWSGSHLFDPNLIPGILFSNKEVTSEKPSILDITPTILKVVGYVPEEIEDFDLDGNSLF